MPRFDFKCHPCDRIDTNVWVSVDAAAPNNRRTCYVCGALMEKLPAAPNFSVKGYNAANGYTHK